jgi:hypothetical protein
MFNSYSHAIVFFLKFVISCVAVAVDVASSLGGPSSTKALDFNFFTAGYVIHTDSLFLKTKEDVCLLSVEMRPP